MSLDFVTAKRNNKHGTISPDFIVSGDIKDLMVCGKSFYAVWDESSNLWSTNEYDVRKLVDKELYLENELFKNEYNVLSMKSFDTGSWEKWNRYIKKVPDIYTELDRKIIFADTNITKTDYASFKLSYSMSNEKPINYDKLMTALYDPVERQKIEWAIGSVIAGDSKHIQKFIVLYGPPGSGKGTVLNIIQKLFDKYCGTFSAKSLGSKSDQFALEDFKSNPLVAIDPDADLSHIEDNTRLNAVVSHEVLSVNEKFKPKHAMAFHSFIFMGTNTLVKITDAKSGLNRRLIDVQPSNRTLSYREYNEIISKIDFELGGIAKHCLNVFNELGAGYYNDYIPIAMISGTNDFYNFVNEYYDIFTKNDSTTLKSAWSLYKEYVEYARVAYPLNLMRFKEELKNYFDGYDERKRLPDGTKARNYYSGFRIEKIDGIQTEISTDKTVVDSWMNLEDNVSSVLDTELAKSPAQYAVNTTTARDVPSKKWENVTTVLEQLDSHKTHYVQVPPNHIVIDFDLKNSSGEKDIVLNLEAASKFPKTYAEVSKGGQGLHLHYIYDGDTSMLSSIYDVGIEIKVFTGNGALRRRLSKCNSIPITTINSGLPLKEKKSMVSTKTIQNERHLRIMILKNLRKEIHDNTTQSINFIFKLLEEAYESGIEYDINDMRQDIMTFAARSSNHSSECLELTDKMRYNSEKIAEYIEPESDELVFFDIEVFSNLFMICWKIKGKDKKIRMVNPKPRDVEALLKYRLVGFNNREYDNHIIYAASMGYSTEELYLLSKKIINNEPHSKFGSAYNISYTDVYDFAAKKQSLKKWQIELGITHYENAYPWDKPLPEDKWEEVGDYCCNDVDSTEAVFDHLSGDFKARCMLAKLTGGTPNDTTNQLSLRFIFGKEKHPNLVYTNLTTGEPSEEGRHLTFPYPNAFPEYEYCPGTENKGRGRNMYRGVDLGFGGCVISRPGMYLKPVKTFDVSGMHPASIIALNLFGDKTALFKQLVDIRLCIKHKDFETPKKMLDGMLAEYLDDPKEAKDLSKALKIVVNSLYGLTFAAFDNPARDKRNINNIVALRGALFMKTLWDEVEKMGYTAIHCKTDSIKVVDPDDTITEFILSFGRKYGYEFEVEHSFERICLVNDAVYIAKLAEDDPDEPGKWTATGTQFQVPYVFKTLFSHEDITFNDICETKSVKSAMYLDFNESLSEDDHDYKFVGRVGRFCPIKPGYGGGLLMRLANTGKYGAVTGTKGYRWFESEIIDDTSIVDYSYFNKMCDDAVDAISQFGNFDDFVE